MTDDGGWLIPDEIPPHLLDDDGRITFAASGPPMTIFGRPVFESEKLPAIGTVGDISFVDPRYLTRWIEHRLFMAAAHNAWEMLYGTPSGPCDPRRAGHPRGIIETPAVLAEADVVELKRQWTGDVSDGVDGA